MIGQYLKNLFSKKATTSVASPTVITTYTSLKIRNNSRISIDLTDFLAYGNLLIMPNLENDLIVDTIKSFSGYGVKVHDITCKAANSGLPYILRIQEDENSSTVINVTLLYKVGREERQQGDWETVRSRVDADTFTWILNRPDQPNFDPAFAANFEIVYFTEMVGVYKTMVQQLHPNNSNFVEVIGKEFYRIIRDDIKQQPVREYLVVEYDHSYINVFCGIDVNPAGIVVI